MSPIVHTLRIPRPMYKYIQAGIVYYSQQYIALINYYLQQQGHSQGWIKSLRRKYSILNMPAKNSGAKINKLLLTFFQLWTRNHKVVVTSVRIVWSTVVWRSWGPLCLYWLLWASNSQILRLGEPEGEEQRKNFVSHALSSLQHLCLRSYSTVRGKYPDFTWHHSPHTISKS